MSTNKKGVGSHLNLQGDIVGTEEEGNQTSLWTLRAVVGMCTPPFDRAQHITSLWMKAYDPFTG